MTHLSPPVSYSTNCYILHSDGCQKKCKEALQINRELDNIKAQIIKHYQHLSDREAFVTAEMVRRSALATLCFQRTLCLCLYLPMLSSVLRSC